MEGRGEGVLVVGADGNPGASSKAVAEKPKPTLCENCGERGPEVLTVSPTLVGKAGLPLDVWLCAGCAAKVPASPRRKKKTMKGRLTTGRYGTTVMRLAYRFGGFTTRQLGEFLLLESPRRFYRDLGIHASTDAAQGDGEVHARALKSATKAAYKHLSHLRGQRLMGSVGVWREHVYGERDGRTEMFFHLEGKGIAWGGSLNDVHKDEEAQKGYEQHQIPKRAEHAAYRNDVYLRTLLDLAVERGLEEGFGEGSPVSKDAGYCVLSGPGDFSGESDPSYPYMVGPFRNKKGEESPRRGRTHEWLYPDGVQIFRWADGVECAFDVEAERTSGAVKGAGKLDRYGAYWLRLYKLHEQRLKEPERTPMAEKLAGMEAERKKVLEVEGAKDISFSTHPHLVKERFAEVRRQIDEIDAREVPYSGLPDGIRPVVFVHPTRTKSANTGRSLARRETPAPRFDAFLEYVGGRMRRWATQELIDIRNGKKAAAPGWRSGGTAQEYARHVLESLVVFTSFEDLQPEVKKNLATGEVYEVDDVGGTLAARYAPLAGAEDQKTDLRRTAELRELLRPEWVPHGDAPREGQVSSW